MNKPKLKVVGGPLARDVELMLDGEHRVSGYFREATITLHPDRPVEIEGKMMLPELELDAHLADDSARAVAARRLLEYLANGSRLFETATLSRDEAFGLLERLGIDVEDEPEEPKGLTDESLVRLTLNDVRQVCEAYRQGRPLVLVTLDGEKAAIAPEDPAHAVERTEFGVPRETRPEGPHKWKTAGDARVRDRRRDHPVGVAHPAVDCLCDQCKIARAAGR